MKARTDFDEPFIRSRVRVRQTDCWEWQGARNAEGRAVYNARYAYRIAYEVFVGPIPAGLQINHHCDNPGCVNPAHLYAGTQQQNMRDALVRGRFVVPAPRRGEAQHIAHPDALAAAVRAECAKGELTKREIAERFNVAVGTVKQWASGSRIGHDPIPMRDERLTERAPCGTRAGYYAHRKHQEPRCEPCWGANRQYMREYKAKRAALGRAA